jgi:MarR family transcriptional regulator, 2-MHQ and catechol-resistance regulon repressor
VPYDWVMPKRPQRISRADLERFYLALSHLLRSYQFRARDRQTVCGITVTQCYALEFLVHEGRLTILELGERLALDKSNASRVVEALELAGAVTRLADPENHRIRWIQPTKEGRRLHSRITGGLQREYSAILAPFGPGFVRRASALFDALSQQARARKKGAATRKT